MFRFSIRDLLWLMVVVALGAAWWIDRRQLALDLEQCFTVKVDGAVVKIDDAQRLIEVSIGSDDGVKLGDVLDVSRGDQWLGHLVAHQVDYDTAVVRIETKRNPIQKGDRVSFKLDTRRITESTSTSIVDRRHP
jgi:hypothetical protein